MTKVRCSKRFMLFVVTDGSKRVEVVAATSTDALSEAAQSGAFPRGVGLWIEAYR